MNLKKYVRLVSNWLRIFKTKKVWTIVELQMHSTYGKKSNKSVAELF